MTRQQLCAWVLGLLSPGILVLAAMRGEPWRLLDRPIFDATIVDREFDPSMGRGFVVAFAVAAVLTAGLAIRPPGARAAPPRTVHAALLAVAILVLAPLTHAFYLAEAVGVQRLGNPVETQTIGVTLAMMTAAEWREAAPYMLLTSYAIAGIAAVLGLVGIHAKEHRRSARPPGPNYNIWSGRR